MKRRRSFGDSDDEFTVGELHQSKCAKIHGVLTQLSPMKASNSGKSNYFEGKLTDGKSKVRFVGFDSKARDKLSDFHQNKEALSLSNCEVKECKYSYDLEVVVRKSSEPRSQSYSKFEVSPNMFDETDDHITMDEIPRLVNYQRVSVKVKVIGEEDATAVKKGLMKQDYNIIANRTGSCKIVTWEDNVGLLQVGNCYELSWLLIRAFKGTKYLSIPKDNFKIENIDDIEEVDNGTVQLEKNKKLKNVTIIGVKFSSITMHVMRAQVKSCHVRMS